MVLGTFGMVSAQYLVSPVKKVIPNHFYSVSELKDFINSDDPVVGSWINNFLILVQDGLLKCNEDLFIVKGNSNPKDVALDIINRYCFLTTRDLDGGFKNSGRTKSNTIKFVIDPRSFSNMEFLTFKYGSCEKDIVKMNCFNLPDLKERKVFVSKPKLTSEPVPEQFNEDNSLPGDIGGKKKVLATNSSVPSNPEPDLNLNQKKSTCWSRMTRTERRLVRTGAGLLTLAGAYFIVDPFGDKGETEVIIEKPEPFHPVDANPQGLLKSRGFTVSFHF